MEVQFTGKLPDIEQQADKWVSEHPNAKVLWRGGPIRIGYRDGEDIFQKDDWTITIKYEEPA